MTRNPPAILLGGGSVALAVARNLGRRGIPVIALGSSTEPLRHSRYCSTFVDLGSGDGVEARWLAWLLDRPVEEAVVMPCCDDALHLVATERARFVDRGLKVVEANDEIVLAMLDKDATYALARSLGVPAPRTVLVKAGEPLILPTGFEFPCALKPRYSHELRRHVAGGVKAYRAANREELDGHLADMAALGLDMIATEVIPGPESSFHSYYGYLDDHGDLLLELTKRKLRQYPIGFGLATYHVIEDNEESRSLGRRFFQGIGLRGLACVEFKRDARDSQLKLIECNHRFTLGTPLVQRAGADLAMVSYNRALGRPAPAVVGPRIGLHQWHPGQDFRAFLAYRQAGELTTWAWLRSLAHPQSFPTFAGDDLRPSIQKLRHRLAALVRRPRH